jgi:DNA-binding CsgD family transcriptional regulator
MVAEGIAAALARFPHLVPVGTATTAAEAERRGRAVDAAAIDSEIEGAAALAARLRANGVRVAMIGATSGEPDELRVSEHSSVASLAAALAPGRHTEGDHPAALTRREREILALGARGLAAKQVARQLGISPKTVEQHKTRIFAKLGVRNQVAAVSIALRTQPGFIAGDFAAVSPTVEVRDFPGYHVTPEAATV